MRMARGAAVVVATALLLGSCAVGVSPEPDPARGRGATVPGYPALAALSQCRLWAEVAWRVALDRDFGADGERILQGLASQPVTVYTRQMFLIVRFAHANPELPRAAVKQRIYDGCRRHHGLPDAPAPGAP